MNTKTATEFEKNANVNDNAQIYSQRMESSIDATQIKQTIDRMKTYRSKYERKFKTHSKQTQTKGIQIESCATP